MKKIFLAVVALAAMTACSNDEFVSVDRAPINFGEAFVDNATRATDPTYGGTKTLDHFYVYATVTGNQGTVRIFGGEEVTGTVGSNDDDADGVMTPNIWTCSTKTEYWVPGADYKFAAVVDYWSIDAKNADDTLGLPKIIGYSTDIANGDVYQKDLLYATAEVTDASADQGPVNFTFQHLLSKVQFTVTSTAQGSYSHSIKNITVKNFQNGDYIIAYDAEGNDISYWTGITPKNISFGNIDGVTNGSKTNATQMLLIPTNEDFVVSFDVEVWKNGTKISSEPKTVTVTDKPLVKGNAYNFTIECELNSPIKFSVTDNPTGWANGGELNVQ